MPIDSKKSADTGADHPADLAELLKPALERRRRRGDGDRRRHHHSRMAARKEKPNRQWALTDLDGRFLVINDSSTSVSVFANSGYKPPPARATRSGTRQPVPHATLGHEPTFGMCDNLLRY